MVRISSIDSSLHPTIEGWIPTLTDNYQTIRYQPDASGAMERAVKFNRTDELISLRSIKPKWNAKQQAHVLDFRVIYI